MRSKYRVLIIAILSILTLYLNIGYCDTLIGLENGRIEIFEDILYVRPFVVLEYSRKMEDCETYREKFQGLLTQLTAQLENASKEDYFSVTVGKLYGIDLGNKEIMNNYKNYDDTEDSFLLNVGIHFATGSYFNNIRIDFLSNNLDEPDKLYAGNIDFNYKDFINLGSGYYRENNLHYLIDNYHNKTMEIFHCYAGITPLSFINLDYNFIRGTYQDKKINNQNYELNLNIPIKDKIQIFSSYNFIQTTKGYEEFSKIFDESYEENYFRFDSSFDTNTYQHYYSGSISLFLKGFKANISALYKDLFINYRKYREALKYPLLKYYINLEFNFDKLGLFKGTPILNTGYFILSRLYTKENSTSINYSHSDARIENKYSIVFNKNKGVSLGIHYSNIYNNQELLIQNNLIREELLRFTLDIGLKKAMTIFHEETFRY